MDIFDVTSRFDVFRVPDLADIAITPEFELLDADGFQLLDADGFELTVTA